MKNNISHSVHLCLYFIYFIKFLVLRMFVVKTIQLSKKYSNQNHIVLLFDTSATLIRLRSNIDVNYMTITQRLRSLFKYFVYLLDEYGFVAQRFKIKVILFYSNLSDERHRLSRGMRAT